jgi:Type II secretion system (T2SS), protein K
MQSPVETVRIATLLAGDKTVSIMGDSNHPLQGLRSKHGFVLFTVIWLVAAIAVVTTMFVTRSQNAKILERALNSNRELELAADGLVRLQAFRLAKKSVVASDAALDARGAVRSCAWNSTLQLNFTIQDQAGLVDINAASPELMTRLLTGMGVEKDKVLTLREAILDYRDPEMTQSGGRLETDDYPTQGPWPSNLPFLAIEELDRIPNISEPQFVKLLRITTVHSQQQGIDPTVASDELLHVLASAADKLPITLQSPSPKRVYAITVQAIRKGGGHFTRHAVVAITGQPDRPYVVLKWAKRDKDFLHEIRRESGSCFALRRAKQF